MNAINEMKPVKNRVLVKVDLLQKSDFEFETDGGLRLYGNKDFGYDGKVTRPVLAEVVTDSPSLGLVKGDAIVCHHNTFCREVGHGYMYGDTGIREGRISVFAVDQSQIQCKVDAATGDPLPLPGFTLVERIPVEHKVQHIVTAPTSAYVPNQFRVVVPGRGTGEYEDVVLASGDIIIAYKKSDYTIEYTYKLKQHTTVRVKYADILAISKQVYQ